MLNFVGFLILAVSISDEIHLLKQFILKNFYYTLRTAVGAHQNACVCFITEQTKLQ